MQAESNESEEQETLHTIHALVNGNIMQIRWCVAYIYLRRLMWCWCTEGEGYFSYYEEVSTFYSIGGSRNPKFQMYMNMALNQLLVALDGFIRKMRA